MIKAAEGSHGSCAAVKPYRLVTPAMLSGSQFVSIGGELFIASASMHKACQSGSGRPSTAFNFACPYTGQAFIAPDRGSACAEVCQPVCDRGTQWTPPKRWRPAEARFIPKKPTLVAVCFCITFFFAALGSLLACVTACWACKVRLLAAVPICAARTCHMNGTLRC